MLFIICKLIACQCLERHLNRDCTCTQRKCNRIKVYKCKSVCILFDVLVKVHVRQERNSESSMVCGTIYTNSEAHVKDLFVFPF